MNGSPSIVPWAEITPDWMTAALQAAGHAVTVTALDKRRVGTGQVGESVRFTPTYERPVDGAPTTVVGKFPATDPVSRATGVGFGNYRREVMFYRHLAASARVTTPRVLLSDLDEETHDFFLLMEDLAPAQAGDQLRGVTAEQSGLVMDEAAKLHSSHWNDDVMDTLPWLSGVSAAPPSAGGDLFRELWAGFRARYADRISDHHIRIGETLTGAFEKFAAYKGPRCLVHHDFRPDNMMFGTAEGGYPLAVVDWQSLGYGCCMADVSYFMAGAFKPEERRHRERGLLERYHAGLQAGGVTDYEFDQLWRDYARYSFSLFNMAFTASMIVERTPRGDEMFLAMMESGAAQVTDLGAMELLLAER